MRLLSHPDLSEACTSHTVCPCSVHGVATAIVHCRGPALKSHAGRQLLRKAHRHLLCRPSAPFRAGDEVLVRHWSAAGACFVEVVAQRACNSNVLLK